MHRIVQQPPSLSHQFWFWTTCHGQLFLLSKRGWCNERVILRLCRQYIVNQRECYSSRRSRNVVRDDRIYNNRKAEIMMGKEHAGKP